MKPDQHSFSADKPVVINERGLRGPVVPYERTPGVHRILFLGDSIAFGYGVDDAEVVSERVRNLLGAAGVSAEVINSSVPAYNMRQEVTYLETEGVHYDPDWVIVDVCWNDIGDKSAVRVDDLGQLTTDLGTKEPVTAQMSESPLGYQIRNVIKRSRLIYGALEGWRLFASRGTPDPQTLFRMAVLEGSTSPQITDGWNDVRTEVQRLRALAERGKFHVLMVTYPIPLAVEQSFPNSSYPARLQQIAKQEDIPVLDLDPSFRAALHGHESLFISYDGDHPNAEGHAIAAREIVDYLRSTGFGT
jgi:lysophospholipase L1-like esterase